MVTPSILIAPLYYMHAPHHIWGFFYLCAIFRGVSRVATTFRVVYHNGAPLSKGFSTTFNLPKVDASLLCLLILGHPFSEGLNHSKYATNVVALL